MTSQRFIQNLQDKLLHIAECLLGQQLLKDILRHADPSHQVVLEIPTVTNPWQRVFLGGVGIIGLAGIPLAAILPILPTMPFALVALVCFARVSTRFQRWLLASSACKMALSMIYTRPYQPFIFFRKLIHFLLGNPKIQGV